MAAARPVNASSSFIRAIRSCRPNTYQSIRTPPSTAKSKLHTSCPRAQTAYPNRYGPAATENLPPPPKPSEPLSQQTQKSKSATTSEPQAQPQSQTQTTTPEESRNEHLEEEEHETEEQVSAQKKEDSEAHDEDLAEHEDEHDPETASTNSLATSNLPPSPYKDSEVDTTKKLENRELDVVLSVPAPSEISDTGSKPRHPHLEPSPYEHHFDTYTLVQDLASESQTFTEVQSITLMKAIRLMLSINLDLAKEGLVSKSNVENESYLFRAACSELRTTLIGARAAESQKQRAQRAHLQHEMDILNQKVTQDVMNMREELKAMFNDRKMGLQEEKRKIDSQISEINYEITVLLNSEAKSEVESLRWVLTRRAAMAIVAAAFMTLSALQYYSIKSRENAEVEKKRAAVQKAQDEKIASEGQKFSSGTRDGATQTQMREYEETMG